MCSDNCGETQDTARSRRTDGTQRGDPQRTRTDEDEVPGRRRICQRKTQVRVYYNYYGSLLNISLQNLLERLKRGCLLCSKFLIGA